MHKIIAYNDGEIPELWTVEATDGGFRCRTWSLDPDRFPERPAALSGAAADLGAPDSDATLLDLDSVEAHLGGDHDQALRSAAREFVARIRSA